MTHTRTRIALLFWVVCDLWKGFFWMFLQHYCKHCCGVLLISIGIYMYFAAYFGGSVIWFGTFIYWWKSILVHYEQLYIYWWKSMRRVHMSVVTASRGEMMQVTPDAARDRDPRELFICLLLPFCIQ